MSRLTETDSQGNWALSGVAWKSLYAGQVITDGMWEKIYGALWKLMEYENTGSLITSGCLEMHILSVVHYRFVMLWHGCLCQSRIEETEVSDYETN